MKTELAVVSESDLTVINSFLDNMKMKRLDEVALHFSPRKTYKITLNDKIIAFICYIVLADEIELEAIYVDVKFRQMGYGDQLMTKMLQEASILECKELFLEVRESNMGAISLYQKNDFEIVACRKNYYGDENGLVMKKEVR